VLHIERYTDVPGGVRSNGDYHATTRMTMTVTMVAATTRTTGPLESRARVPLSGRPLGRGERTCVRLLTLPASHEEKPSYLFVSEHEEREREGRTTRSHVGERVTLSLSLSLSFFLSLSLSLAREFPPHL